MYNEQNDNFFEENSQPKRVIKKKKKSDNFVFVWTVTAILASILISFGILLVLNINWLPAVLKEKFNSLSKVVQNAPGMSLIGGRQNILLLGVDSNGKHTDPFKGTRSDTIMLFSIDPMSKSVNVVSIPRDSKVYLAGNYGVDKINAAHSFGGPGLTVRTIEDNFGVRINHYITVDYNGVKELVDALGGIPVYVEKRMRYRDRSAGLNIDLNPGYQVLNAEQAEGYLRYRHDAIGDIGRMRRQQYFVKGLVQRMQSPDMIVKIPQMIQLASKYIRTDMNFYELSQFAAFGKSVNLSSVQSATLPGSPSSRGHVSYWILDTDKSQNIIDRLIFREGSEQKTTPVTVSIVYPSTLSDKVALAKPELEKLGYVVSCKRVGKEPHSQILAHSQYASPSHADTFKKLIPQLEGAQFIIQPDNYLCGSTDLTIVLGADTN